MEILFVHIVQMFKIMFGRKRVITRMINYTEKIIIRKNTDIIVNSCKNDKKIP